MNTRVEKEETTMFRKLSRSAQPVRVIATQSTQNLSMALASFRAKTAPRSVGSQSGAADHHAGSRSESWVRTSKQAKGGKDAFG